MKKLKRLARLEKEIRKPNAEKLTALETTNLWIKWSLSMVFKWIGKWAIALGILVLLWVFHTKDVGAKEAGLINWSGTAKKFGSYFLRTFGNIVVLFGAMLIITVFNKDEWKEYKQNAKDNKNT